MREPQLSRHKAIPPPSGMETILAPSRAANDVERDNREQAVTGMGNGIRTHGYREQPASCAEGNRTSMALQGRCDRTTACLSLWRRLSRHVKTLSSVHVHTVASPQVMREVLHHFP